MVTMKQSKDLLSDKSTTKVTLNNIKDEIILNDIIWQF